MKLRAALRAQRELCPFYEVRFIECVLSSMRMLNFVNVTIALPLRGHIRDSLDVSMTYAFQQRAHETT
jgi:hypothetical protein